MIALLLKLLLAHVLGDFVLQPDKWVEKKKDRKTRFPYLLLHGLVHLALLLVLLKFSLEYAIGIAVIVVSHLLIDWLKLELQRFNGRWLFFADQVAHIAVILLVISYYFQFSIPYQNFLNPQTLLLTLALLTVTFASGVVMRVLTSRWMISEEQEGESLPDAGKYIGMLERLFVFGFVAMNYWAGIGFLLAAKSIFRFGDLTRAKDRKLTEYILIGTLLSFGIAIFIGLVYNKLKLIISIIA
ncbi:DUF3307 domain-containing protein [Halocola ammonii]